ncbi:MAG: LytR/AlgR family response regulator transcription factor [Sphingomonas sp.]
MTRLDVMIVDDEPVAVRRLAALLRDCRDVHVTATAANAEQALTLADRAVPDLVLLDIEMPGLDGIALARRLAALDPQPAVVFVTAFGRFALDAFGLAATDYLVKPVEPDRIAEAIARVRAQRAARGAEARIGELEALVERLRGFEQGSDEELTLWLPDRRGRERVRLHDILWIEAERDYVHVHTAQHRYFLRGRIGEVAARLAESGFVRIHRSAVVRVAAIERIESRGDRAWRLFLSNGECIDASRRFAAALQVISTNDSF